MPILTPLTEAEATDKVQQTYERIKEMLGTAAVPEPFLVYARVPAFLQDFFMNAKRFIFTDGKLTLKQKTLIAFIVSATQHSQPWVPFFTERMEMVGWSTQECADAVAVAATCATYNAFFKFRDLSEKSVFQGMSVGLRAHTFGGTSLDAATVELINIVVSDLNTCHACVRGHVEKAIELGMNEDVIHEAIQCAATMFGGITFLRAAD